MGVIFAVDVRDDLTSEFSNLLNTALGSGATLDFFDGVMPGTCEAGDAGTLLASLALDNPVWVYTSGNLFQATIPSSSTIITSGTATYWRMKSSGTVTFAQGEVSNGSPPASIEFNTLVWTSSQTIDVDTITVLVTLAGIP